MLCPWQSIPLEMKVYKRFVFDKSEACYYLLYLDSLEIKGLHIQQWQRKDDCVFNYFESIQNEHMVKHGIRVFSFLAFLHTSKAELLLKYHTPALGFSFSWRWVRVMKLFIRVTQDRYVRHGSSSTKAYNSNAS